MCDKLEKDTMYTIFAAIYM